MPKVVYASLLLWFIVCFSTFAQARVGILCPGFKPNPVLPSLKSAPCQEPFTPVLKFKNVFPDVTSSKLRLPQVKPFFPLSEPFGPPAKPIFPFPKPFGPPAKPIFPFPKPFGPPAKPVFPIPKPVGPGISPIFPFPWPFAPPVNPDALSAPTLISHRVLGLIIKPSPNIQLPKTLGSSKPSGITKVKSICDLLSIIRILNGLSDTKTKTEDEDEEEDKESNGCEIWIDKKPPIHQPLILHFDTKEIRYPTEFNVIRLRKDSQISLACPGQGNSFKYFASTAEVAAVCIKNDIFQVKGINMSFSALGCRRNLGDQYLLSHSPQCPATALDVGYATQSRFVTVFMSCFNTTSLEPIWSHHYMGWMASMGSVNSPSRYFTKNGLYPTSLNMDRIYTMVEQNATFTRILGNSTSYIRNDGKLFLAKGHLAAFGDFLYAAQKSASNWYINSAPQWQSFNNGNWKTMELDLRQLAKDRHLVFSIYTGVYSLSQIDGTDLYLDPINRRIAVHRFFWKVVYHEPTGTAIALVGLNNPYQGEENDLPCTAVSEDVPWLHWVPNSREKGFVRACHVADLAERIPTVPNIPVRGLLL